MNSKRSVVTQKQYDTFKELQEADEFVDMTDFILYFDKKCGGASCILRPRRTGKSLTIKMLKEFYCVPRIDVDSYDPVTKRHKNENFTSKATFENTLVMNPDVRKNIFAEKSFKGSPATFIDDNMNKWPVVVVDLLQVGFDSFAPSKSEIYRKLFQSPIKGAFEQYDYVLFIRMVEEACLLKYKEVTRKTYLRILKDHKIDKNMTLSARIEILWDNYGEKMDQEIKDFYRFYKGNPPYEGIKRSLETLAKILKEFYGKQVIVLVDEHDTPAHHLYMQISLSNPENNIELLKSINLYAELITEIFKNVGKGAEDYIKNFLMFGISNCIVDTPLSGFNNLEVFNAFNSDYSKFFSMTQKDVNDTVDSLFDIRPELKDEIKSNIFKWYNGYYCENNLPIYSLYSTGKYVIDCYKNYIKNAISPNETSLQWIPKPQRYWAHINLTNTLITYLNIGFEGKFNRFLLDLIRGLPAKFSGWNKDFPPLLLNPENPDERAKIIFHLLLQLGFLTFHEDGGQYFKIPNKEVLELIDEEFQKYIDTFPIKEKTISSISEALLKEDYEKLGDEIMESLHYSSLADNSPDSGKFRDHRKVTNDNRPKHLLELYIHALLWKVFKSLNDNGDYHHFVRLE
jgi:hypothetical protein